MGKTQEIPKQLPPKKIKARGKALSQKPPLTSGQAARLAAFRAVMKFQKEQWEQMSPKERREADEKWLLVKKSINADRAGDRQAFVVE